MKKKLSLLGAHMLVANKRIEGWIFSILFGFAGAFKSQIGILNCDTKKETSNTLWNSNADDDIIKILCDIVQQWWWVAALAAGILWGVFNWVGNEKMAERFKKGTFAIIILYFASLLEPQIRASVEEIGKALAG